MRICDLLISSKNGRPLVRRLHSPWKYFQQLRLALSKNFSQSGFLDPIFSLNGFYVVTVQIDQVYFVVVGESPTLNAMDTTYFLIQLGKLIRYYLELHLSDTSVLLNCFVCSQILEKVSDMGFLDIPERSIVNNILQVDSGKKNSVANEINNQHSWDVTWRNPNTFYSSNEIHVDVVERLIQLVSADGLTLRCNILGYVNCKTRLTGMPRCRMGTNELNKIKPIQVEVKKFIEYDTVSYHQCVNSQSSSISFIPPDGSFSLMKYSIKHPHNAPLFIRVEDLKHRLHKKDYFVQFSINSSIPNNKVLKHITVMIPLPKECKKIRVAKAARGTTVISRSIPNEPMVVWKISDLCNQSVNIKISAMVPKKIDRLYAKPIRIDFTVPQFALSGLQIRYLQVVEKCSYAVHRWLRYITKSGAVERMQPCIIRKD